MLYSSPSQRFRSIVRQRSEQNGNELLFSDSKRLVQTGQVIVDIFAASRRCHLPRDIFGNQVRFEVHRIAGRQPAQRRRRQRVGNQCDAEPLGFDIDDRQAHAIHRDRAF